MISPNMSARDTDDAWVHAIYQSTECLRTSNSGRVTGGRSRNGRSNTGAYNSRNVGSSGSVQSLPSSITKSLEYLDVLRNNLETSIGGDSNRYGDREVLLDDRPSSFQPPKWSTFSKSFDKDPLYARTEAINNIESENEETDDFDEAGDIPNPSAFSATATNDNLMSRRRILIRILTFQSELYAKMSDVIVQQHQQENKEGGQQSSSSFSVSFQDAASQLKFALEKIHMAIQLADSWIAKSEQQEQEQLAINISTPSVSPTNINNHVLKEHLKKDSEIVAVAIESLTTRRDWLLKQIEREENFLLRKLRPQWQDRDAIKNRLGDRWTNNPHPKNDFAELRREYEERLRAARSAREQLEDDGSGQSWTNAIHKAKSLQNYIHTGIFSEALAMEDPESARNGTSAIESNEQRRYNQQEPHPRFDDRRIDPQLYPSPTMFGWTFTGSWETVEFYEKHVDDEHKDGSSNSNRRRDTLVKLDWYFTTGTIKTSLDHPSQGRTQMFGRQVSPEEYTQILTNPRAHTGRRYQQKNVRSGNSNRGRGRGRSRSGGGRGRSGGRGRGRGPGRGS